MIDINFFMKIHGLKKKLMADEQINKNYVSNLFESSRSRDPVIYNIETTNACNMKCQMCPRTTMMTRKVETLDQRIFQNIVDQLKPFTDKEWNRWESFVSAEYGIPKNDMSENHFYLYIIPRVIQLHGYGDPLLDKKMSSRVKYLKERGFSTYFSCNPSNINIDKNLEMFESGLDYIKYSIESVDDFLHKQIRGEASDFTGSYKKIIKLHDEIKKRKLNTVIVITMLDLHRQNQLAEYRKLKDAFKNQEVYIYLKSQDQQWYLGQNYGTKSIHWSEFCMHPWMSMTIKSDAKAAMCMEDFNNDIVLGDARKQELIDIWNGDKYRDFRKAHFSLQKGMKCSEQCDMTLIGSFFE